MKLNRVLVVIKPHGSGASRRLGSRRRMVRPCEHSETLARVVTCLAAAGISHRVVPRDRIPRRRDWDLVVPVGGDGTFLAAAHAAGEVPLLGVNSMPEKSVGFFCAATASSFKAILARILAGRLRPSALPLLEARIDGHPLPITALNDVLFAGISPAETVRYEIAVGGRREEQRSSGVWIAAGPGSTAAIRSAGGRALGLSSTRLQFLVREPCPLPTHCYRRTRGLLPSGARIVVTSLMKHGMIYLDGHWHAYPVPTGSKVICSISRKRLKVFLGKAR